jgi:hypothetical protein
MNVNDVCDTLPTTAKHRRDLIRKLQRVYAKTNAGTDSFGKRQALPSEIERAVRAARQTSDQMGIESR